MKNDPVLVEETRAWLIKAAMDIKAAKHDFSADPPILGDIVFHCQQAVEKAFKGYLTWHSQRFRKTHSLEEIGEQCVDIDSTLKDIVDMVVPLTEYAWKYRYPGPFEEPPLEEAENAMKTVNFVYEEIIRRLPESVRP